MESEAPGIHREAPIPAAAWLLLALLTGVNVLNFVVRQLIPSLAPLLIGDLGLTRSQIGTLVGFAFVVLYSVVGLLLGSVADRWPRRALIAAGLALWSAMSLVSAAARGFGELAAARLFSGVGQAALAPAALAMLADAFPRRRLGLASGIYYAGLPIGTALSLALAGWLAPRHGWRACFEVAGVAGLAAVAFVAFAREPDRERANTKRRAARATERDSAGTEPPLADPGRGTRDVEARPTLASLAADVWRALRDRPALVLVMISGSALTYFSAAATHGITWLVQERGFSFGSAAWLSALMVIVSGFLGNLAGGWFSDWCTARWPGGRAWALALLTILFAPFSLAFYLVPAGGAIFYACWVVSAASTVAYFGPVFSAVNDLAPPHVRAGLVAFAVLVLNLLGVGPGSLVTGAIGDRASLTLGLALSVVVSLVGVVPAVVAAKIERRV